MTRLHLTLALTLAVFTVLATSTPTVRAQTNEIARFPGGRLVALSAVGFNAAKTRALVAMQSDCFPSWTPGKEHAVCREGRHIAVEKKDGRWNVVPSVRIGCNWAA